MDTDTGTAVVQLLLDAGANVNVPSDEGETPFYVASSNGLESLTKKMLECGAVVNGNNGKKVPLNAACKKKQVSVVQLLLANGTNPNVLEEHDECSYPRPSECSADKGPLIEACLTQNVELVDMLLEYGADPNMLYMSCKHVIVYNS